jgi:type II secretory ATPase GspE/PulE/Tfp pilus assembly ATPase PilB-like protein
MEHADMMSGFPKLAKACRDGGCEFPHNLATLHAHLAQKLETHWGSKECVGLLDNLVFSDRPDRLGFSFDVLRELFALREIHGESFPQLTYSTSDPFSSAVNRAGAAQKAAPGGVAASKGTRPVKDVFVPAKPDRRESSPVAETVPATQPSAVSAAAAPQPAPTAKPSLWPEVGSLEELREIMSRRGRGERLPARDGRKMLEILKEYLALENAVVEPALRIQRQTATKLGPVGKILLSMGVIGPEDITRALCLQYGLLMVNLQRFQTPPDVAKLVSQELIRKHRAVPVAALDGVLFLAVENPFAFEQREYFGFLAKLKVELVMASAEQIGQRLAEFGQVRSVKQGDQEFRSLARQALPEATDEIETEDISDADAEELISQNDASIVGLVNKIVADAAEIGASDIHIECFPGDPIARIRFRRDGRMEEYSQYAASYHRVVVSRIKIMASLNIAERRMAQDGKISFNRRNGQRLDLRVATIPTVRNIENVTIRLLHAGDPLPLEKLNMGERDIAVFRKLVARPHGLLLVCGPTGSGKTTTLHSALRELNRPESKIWTAEDPIEIVQKNICQVQVKPQIGWTFAMALRSFLRADPDIIMVGEMRDLETAGIALEASMTGHLVLSTLHTNSAAETAARLVDLGIDPFNLSDALIGVLAQRLTRSLCPRCAQKREMTAEEVDDLAAEYHFSAHQRLPTKPERDGIVDAWHALLGNGDAFSAWSPKGCGNCSMEGYKGRVALFELLEVTPQFREAVAHKLSAADLQKIAVEQGMRTLKQDGIEKALRGLTDLSQVRAVCC